MKVRVRNANELYVGQKVRYKSGGFEVHDNTGVQRVSVNAEYDAEVIQITDHLVALRMTADQGTLHRLCIWKAKPYNWSITRSDINHGFETLYREAYE